MKTTINALIIGTNWIGGVAYKLAKLDIVDTTFNDGDFQEIKHIDVISVTTRDFNDLEDCVVTKEYFLNSSLVESINDSLIKDFDFLETHNLNTIDILEELN